MMREVVDDGNAVDLRLHFQPALHALECLQSIGNGLFRNAAGGGKRGRGSRVPHVVFAGERKFETGPELAVVHNAPRRASWIQPQIRNSPVRTSTRTVTFDWTKCLRYTALQARALRCISRCAVESHDPPASRNQIDQPLESRLHSV